ncbi:MAG TPA: BadF/BadG/BcrA/BcrD ATPase family protein [Pyrinomonadaceae bacterium]|jgi:N-acetylglucosamine kinase-like BadF-type ATPase|nr:BadF/BadG/BcrA/BcrD ATPase family protein [Pyrinomonadaceae bacterium]
MPQTSKKISIRSHNLYLGVDGGGTKTQIAIIGHDRQLICEGYAGASNPLRVGVETAVNNIIAAINSACDSVDKNRGDIVSATLGLAGVRRADLKQIIHERIVEKLRIKKVQVLTDAEIALYGIGNNKAGLVIIAGTGSVCIGQNAKGEKFSAGGWGPLAGDEGGGAGIALNALHKIAKASDGRGRPTILSDIAVDYFRAGKIENLSVAIYAPQVDNARIAGFARFVGEAAAEGDKVAIEILREAGFELGTAAYAVIKKLNLQRTKVPIGLVGSVFQSGSLVTAPLLQTVHKIAPKAYLLDKLIQPAHSAAQMAYENNGNGGRR